jgi:hypothetical protein
MSQVAHILTGVPRVPIGDQMVAILEAEYGVRHRFTTADVAALLDVRALADSTQEAANRLLAAGFGPEQHDIRALGGAGLSLRRPGRDWV